MKLGFFFFIMKINNAPPFLKRIEERQAREIKIGRRTCYLGVQCPEAVANH